MRTLAIGDIHGCYEAMLALVRFAGISQQDQIIWLGDYVDRGPDSAKVIEHLHSIPGERNFFLRGNHEVMMLNARTSVHALRSWASSGGGETWDSYLNEYGGGNGVESVPEGHWRFMNDLLPYFETESHIFVHASIDCELEMKDQFEDALFWGEFDSIGPHISGKHVVCGHTSQKDGVPRSTPFATCIDTWACGSGWLTCLEVNSGRYFQANQACETREGWLSD